MIPINENFEKAYKDSMAKGFTVKELFAVFSAAASLAVVCVVCFFVLHWNLYLSFFLGLPPAAVMILVGFWRSASGLTVKEAYDARRYREKTELLCYQSTEYERELDLYQEILEAVSEETERKRK